MMIDGAVLNLIKTVLDIIIVVEKKIIIKFFYYSAIVKAVSGYIYIEPSLIYFSINTILYNVY